MPVPDIEFAVGVHGVETSLGPVYAGLTRRGEGGGHPAGASFWPAGTHAERDVDLTRRVLAHTLHRHVSDFRLLKQVHGTRVVRREAVPDTIPAADAHFTAVSGPVLVVNVADCCPVIVVSPDAALVGIAHSGWRGTAAGVVPALVAAMTDAGADPATMRAWIGPCADGDAYEVGADVAARFSRWSKAVAPHPQDDTKRLLDVGTAVAAQLRAAGIADTAVRRSSGGTITDRRYHSHRRSHFAAGRMAAFVTIG